MIPRIFVPRLLKLCRAKPVLSKENDGLDMSALFRETKSMLVDLNMPNDILNHGDEEDLAEVDSYIEQDSGPNNLEVDPQLPQELEQASEDVKTEQESKTPKVPMECSHHTTY